jgi:hypothetical protein
MIKIKLQSRGKEKYITQDPIENFEDLRLSLQDLLLHIGKECNLTFLDSVFNSMVEKNIVLFQT